MCVFWWLVAMIVMGGTVAWAQHFRPNHPLMDFVPQNMGIDDKPYSAFMEGDCRDCHGNSTAARHHETQPALEDTCLVEQGGCHDVMPDLPDVEPVRDCKACHTDDETVYPGFFAVWGDLGHPHHHSDMAVTGQCNVCHEHVAEAYSVSPPAYATSSTTPSPASCENCHFWDDPGNPAVHGSGHIESWGAFGVMMHPDKVNLGFDPDALPSKGTHMETNGVVYPQCYFCHASSLLTGGNWDPYDPETIRFCETCHTIESLHQNPEHRDTNTIYTVNGIPNQEITEEEKCTGCHETDLVRSYAPELVPPLGGYGTTIVVDGFRFGEEPFGMLDSEFGYYKVVTLSGSSGTFVATKYPLWSDFELKVRFSDLFLDTDGDHLHDGDEPLLTQDQLSLGEYSLAVTTLWFFDGNGNNIYDNGEVFYEDLPGDSPLFAMTDDPVVSAVRPRTQTAGKVVRIKGLSFGEIQGDSVVHVGPKTFDASSARIKLWSDNTIKLRLPKYKCDWFHGEDTRNRKVWVTVGGDDSNVKKIKVSKPDTCP